MSRVETGPIRFGNDWPGVFIRGDEAMGTAIALENLRNTVELSPPDGETVDGLIELLKSADLNAKSPDVRTAYVLDVPTIAVAGAGPLIQTTNLSAPLPPPRSNCAHPKHSPKFDSRAAVGLSASEVKRRWPRFMGQCEDCGERVIMYASWEHYVSGDW